MGQKEEGLHHGIKRVLTLPRLGDPAPKETAELAEDLGVELDSPEHARLERSRLCIRASESRN